MSLILNIDTSLETASISFARDGKIVSCVKNNIQKEHAVFLHQAIQKLSVQTQLTINEVDAIAVTAGPGSYTGLRVGMASAKGLCYALNKPFITVGTLNALAYASIVQSKDSEIAPSLFCPMIDARRMEVYTAVFDKDMNEILPACAMILNNESFAELLTGNRICFSGSAVPKWNALNNSENASFVWETDIAESLSVLAHHKFLNTDFTDLTYSEPFYVKEFHSA